MTEMPLTINPLVIFKPRYFHRLAILFLCLTFPDYASANFDFNQNCIRAYKSILSFKLKEARAIIATEKQRNPANAIPYLLENYVDYFALQTSESKSDYDKAKNNKNARLARIEKSDKTSPYYLYAQAQINLQWALTRAKFQEYTVSALEITRAQSQFQQSIKKFPSFLPSHCGLAVTNAVLGAVPESLRKTISVLGIRGNLETAVRSLESLNVRIQKSPYAFMKDETAYYLSLVQTDIVGNPDAYSSVIVATESMDASNVMRTYLRAHAAVRSGRSAEAVQLLQRGSGEQSFPYLSYLLGVAKLNMLDPSAAGNLAAFIKEYRGANYVKDAYLRLAWLEILRGEKEAYARYIQQVKLRGAALHSRDKQALAEANDPPPHADLLRSRLSFDAGQYSRALDAIKDNRMADYRIGRDRIEHCYRLGRIYEQLGRTELALKFYQVAIDLGKTERYYFASNAALRTGMIHEKGGNVERARGCYTQAIAMKNHDFEESLESKAKDGLRRIGK